MSASRSATAKFGRALAKAREARGFSQAEFADRHDVSPASISQWEAGVYVPKKPSIVFNLERDLDLEPGTLSRHLGYVPVVRNGTKRPAKPDVFAAIADDERFSPSQARVLTAIIREMISASSD